MWDKRFLHAGCRARVKKLRRASSSRSSTAGGVIAGVQAQIAPQHYFTSACLMGCLHDPANVQQTSSKCIQNTRANAGRLLNRVNTLLATDAAHFGDKHGMKYV